MFKLFVRSTRHKVAQTTPHLVDFSETTSSLLGEGGFARVYRGVLTNGSCVAVKVGKNVSENKCIESELEVLTILKDHGHSNIIKLVDIVQTISNTIVLEFAEIDLHDYIDKLPTKTISEAQARIFFTQMLSATRHIHSLNIAHRDIKLENWLLIKNVVKLSDFGLSRLFSTNSTNKKTNWLLRDVTGSIAYMSPEALNGKVRAYDSRLADTWSLCVCLFVMLNGFFPYERADKSDKHFTLCYDRCRCIIEKFSQIYRDVDANELSPDLKHFLHFSLAVRPRQRVRIEDMTEHAWLSVDQKPAIYTRNNSCQRLCISFNCAVRNAFKIANQRVLRSGTSVKCASIPPRRTNWEHRKHRPRPN